jgi:winged helix DNA-binding protein
MRSLTWDEVWKRRLARHALLAPEPRESLTGVVGAVCGIHAQVMPAAELSLGIRIADATRQDVRAELWERRSLVKTYGIRGTVHLFPASEAPLWSAALQANTDPSDARRLTEMGLDPAQAEAVLAAIGDALDGRCLTRDELGQEVARRAGSWALDAVSPAFGGHWPRWQMMIGAAANAGLLCFGPNQGARVTFVRPSQWLGGWAPVEGSAALREVLRRYLAAYGPATHNEFARWFGMRPGAANALTRQMAGELEEVDVEGHRAWQLADEPEISPPQGGAQDLVRLLPHFDCYGIGCHPRDRLVPADLKERALTRGGIGNVPLVIIAGVVAGVWQYQRRSHHMEIRVQTLHPLSAAQRRKLASAVARVGEIMEAEAALSLGAVDIHPHL